MVKFLLILCVVLMPWVSMADDDASEWIADKICAEMDPNDEMYCLCNPNYGMRVVKLDGRNTVDRRRYVSKEEWRNKAPYKYMVHLIYNTDRDMMVSCSANMVRGKIVTALHCMPTDTCNIGETVRVRDAFGNEFDAQVEACGSLAEPSGDWAVLNPVQMSIADRSVDKVSQWNADSNDGLKVVWSGFGALKVMNDTEIDRFQKAYAKWLKSNNIDEEYRMGTGVSLHSRFQAVAGYKFIQDLLYSNDCRLHPTNSGCYENGRPTATGFNYAACGLSYNDLFYDVYKLKSSICNTYDIRLSSSQQSPGLDVNGCQGWSGDSGAGLYLSDGSLLGLVVKSVAYIGGIEHAGARGSAALFARNFEDKLPPESGTGGEWDVDENSYVSIDTLGDDYMFELYGECAKRHLPANAVRGMYCTDIFEESNLMCQDYYSGYTTACRCGATKCADGYKITGKMGDAVCVPEDSTD